MRQEGDQASLTGLWLKDPGSGGSVYQNGEDGWGVVRVQGVSREVQTGLRESILFRTVALWDPCGSWMSQSGIILRDLAWRFHPGVVDKKMLFKNYDNE